MPLVKTDQRDEKTNLLVNGSSDLKSIIESKINIGKPKGSISVSFEWLRSKDGFYYPIYFRVNSHRLSKKVEIIIDFIACGEKLLQDTDASKKFIEFCNQYRRENLIKFKSYSWSIGFGDIIQEFTFLRKDSKIFIDKLCEIFSDEKNFIGRGHKELWAIKAAFNKEFEDQRILKINNELRRFFLNRPESYTYYVESERGMNLMKRIAANHIVNLFPYELGKKEAQLLAYQSLSDFRKRLKAMMSPLTQEEKDYLYEEEVAVEEVAVNENKMEDISMKPAVLLFINPEDALSIETSALDQDTFSNEFSLALYLYLKDEKRDVSEDINRIQRWQRDAFEVIKKLCGYKSDAEEVRIIRAGSPNFRKEDIVIDTSKFKNASNGAE